MKVNFSNTGTLQLFISALISALLSALHRHRLLGIRGKGLPRLQHVQKLSAVNVQQHSSDFTGLVRVHGLDQEEQALA